MPDPEILHHALMRSRNPWTIECIDSTDSTNLQLSRRFSDSIAAPYLVLACDEQTSGRGRYSRKWLSVAGADITASVIFPLPVPPIDTPKLSLCAGLALVMVLKRDFSINAMIRWPNDVLTSKGKIGGILSTFLSSPKAVICGIGINVNSDANSFDHGSSRPRTSIKTETGIPIILEYVLAQWLLDYESLWSLADSAEYEKLKSAFDEVSYYRGKRLKIYPDKQSARDYIEDSEFLEGVGASINRAGGFEINLINGEAYTVGTDDVLVAID